MRREEERGGEEKRGGKRRKEEERTTDCSLVTDRDEDLSLSASPSLLLWAVMMYRWWV